ncbi:glycoside hydrolase family 2 protein [Ruania zhangjianzhongii]|uniref:glycoside hydrolase family 2 protein n=1 Tax=Ruania zhangjianzhongii TaxID=2603206 RepID=UPI0011CC2FD5|nr:sugar-binding domain-containing protein [Ruania zhangjianzhongii]
MSNQIPRPEYPRPQMVRSEWLNLNGWWDFEVDQGDSGLERGLVEAPLTRSILVPFAPESQASGIGETDFLQAVWYRREIAVPEHWAGQRVLLHFGAVDHDTTVWVGGTEVVRHRGGFSPFTADITDTLTDGRGTITVRARDLREEVQARGKQATWYSNTHCQYTRTTGIWQTVWAEPVPPVHLKRPRITPDVGGECFRIEAPVSANRAGYRLRATLSANGIEITTAQVRADLDLAPALQLTIPAESVRLWSPTDPHLYDLHIELLDETDQVMDAVESYAGLRSVSIDGQHLLLNGKPVFQRLVLDQGYWPQTLMTAPSDEALVRDIELGIAAGFNGARIHQKVAEERYLYHAARLGYLLWGEFGDWGVSGQGTRGHNQQPTASFTTQWLEVLERDYNQPAIIGWCPLNETHQVIHDRITVLDDITRGMFLATKAADTTRPVIDASGYSHRVAETDVYDSHSYEQDPTAFAAEQAGLAHGHPQRNKPADGEFSLPYAGQPFFVSEYGGIWWNAELAAAHASGEQRDASWGYGQRVATEEEFHQRFTGLTAVLLNNPHMFGYCYTQLTDTFQEQNGIYHFDRTQKLNTTRIRTAQQQPAAYEQQ